MFHETVKIVNFIKSRPLFSGIFSVLYGEMVNSYTVLLLPEMFDGYHKAEFYFTYLH